MARCNDCNKFCSLDTDQEPEISLDVSDDGEVTGDVVIANCCAECGTEVTTATLDVAVSADEIKDEDGKSLADYLDGLTKEGRESVSLEVEDEEGERTSRQEGKGARAPTFYGAKVTFNVKLTIEVPTGDGDAVEEKTRIFSGVFEDDVQAGSMDEA